MAEEEEMMDDFAVIGLMMLFLAIGIVIGVALAVLTLCHEAKRRKTLKSREVTKNDNENGVV